MDYWDVCMIVCICNVMYVLERLSRASSHHHLWKLCILYFVPLLSIESWAPTYKLF